MAKLVLVENGFVTNIIVGSSFPGYVNAPDEVQIGWQLVNGAYLAPTPDIVPVVVEQPRPGLIGSAGFTLVDGSVESIELAAQLTGAYYEDGWVQVFFTDEQSLPYLVFAQTDIPCKIEQYKTPSSLELIFSDPATNDPVNPGRIDLHILNVR